MRSTKSDSIKIETADGSYSLYSSKFDEYYHSKFGALKEAKELYISASQLKDYLGHNMRCSVLDVGLGLGYNALATLETFLSSCAKELFLFSIESDEQLVHDLLNGEGAWQINWKAEWQEYLKSVKETGKIVGEGFFSSIKIRQKKINWIIYIGSGEKCLWQELVIKPFDFIWQDPFSPQKNPELWTKEWFSVLHSLSNPKGKLITYSSARKVKDALQVAGWNWTKIKTSTEKRNWLVATKAN